MREEMRSISSEVALARLWVLIPIISTNFRPNRCAVRTKIAVADGCENSRGKDACVFRKSRLRDFGFDSRTYSCRQTFFAKARDVRSEKEVIRRDS